MSFSRTELALSALTCSLGLMACGGDVENPTEENPNEVITTVNLRFAPMGGGSTEQAQFRDADGDGGQTPMITGVTLSVGTTYTTTVEFLNELENPPEDITPEIFDERDEHQTFFVGELVEGPATSVTAGALVRHTYADMDTNGLPIGLTFTIEALQAGTSAFSFGLRHMPLVNQQPQKRPNLASEVATGGGFSSDASATSLPGSWDVVVDIPLTVQ